MENNNLKQETQNQILKETQHHSKKNKIIREFLDWIIHIGLAALIAFVVNYFLIQMTLVNGESMMPSLQDRNWLVMEKISKRFGNLEHGDIVVLDAVKQLQEKGYLTAHSPLIKRIIGLPGDKIEIRNERVYLNGKELKENYINGNNTGSESGQYISVVVPVGQVYVMGDNRLPGMSLDSRRLGTLPMEAIKGRAFLRLLPMKEIGVLK